MKGTGAKETGKRSFFQISELTHIHVPVTNLEKSLQWYSDMLGLEVSFREGNRLVFFALPGSGSLIALTASKRKEIPQPIHFGFKISGGTVAMEAWRLRLRKMGVPFSVKMRGERVSGLYLTDPDGYTVEIYCD
jgi:catechol 2,3-dioxygenase-like lactoylglutathione lyase family enzyme